MDLSPYLESLRHELVAAAAPGGDEVSRASELLAGAMDASARLCLMEALSDAAAEVTAKLGTATVEVRLRGRDADLVVTPFEPAAPEPPPAAGDGAADVARITLRMPEQLKEQVEQAAAAESISVNAWLVRAIGAAVGGRGAPAPPGPPLPPGRASFGRRVTGYAQA